MGRKTQDAKCLGSLRGKSTTRVPHGSAAGVGTVLLTQLYTHRLWRGTILELGEAQSSLHLTVMKWGSKGSKLFHATGETPSQDNKPWKGKQQGM